MQQGLASAPGRFPSPPPSCLGTGAGTGGAGFTGGMGRTAWGTAAMPAAAGSGEKGSVPGATRCQTWSYTRKS